MVSQATNEFSRPSILYNCLPDIRGWMAQTLSRKLHFNHWSWPHCTSSSIISGLLLHSCNACAWKCNNLIPVCISVCILHNWFSRASLTFRNVSKIGPIPSSEDAVKLIHARVTSWLHYCNVREWLSHPCYITVMYSSDSVILEVSTALTKFCSQAPE